MDRGVVLDRRYCDDAMALCFQEGLLTAENDEIVGPLRKPEYRVSPEVKSALLENLVLSGRFVLPMRRYDWVHGEAIDTGLLTFSNPEKADDNDEFLYSPEFLFSFLRAQGLKISPSEILSTATAMQELLAKLETRFEELPAFRTYDEGIPIDEVLRRDFWPEQPSKYSAEDFDDLKKLAVASSKLRPVNHAAAELNAVEAIARKTNAYRLVHLDGGATNNAPRDSGTFLDSAARMFDSSALSDELQVFRVACSNLGALPARSTLRGSFELSQQSETKALRSQISSWIEALIKLDVPEMELISKDVASASKWLQEAKDIATVSEMITYAGFPVALLGLISPELTAAGIALSAFGAVASAGVRVAQTKFQWAMFGR